MLAGAEIAIITARKSRLKELTDEGRHSASIVQRLRDNPETFLATVQIGITLVSATASVVSGQEFTDELSAWLEPLMPASLISHTKLVAMGIVISAVSYASLVLGELVPKSLALRSSTQYALIVSRPLLWLSYFAKPLVWFLTTSSNVVLRAFGDSTTFTEARLSPEELQLLVDEAARTGSIHPRAGEIATRALEFGDLRVADVMVPRNRVIALSQNADMATLRRALMEEGHARVPVYQDTLDNIVGIISAKDVALLAWEKELVVLQDLIRPAYFAPKTMQAADLLKELQKRHMHFAIVVDESGGTAGIATMEDLLEEIVGEIFGPHDEKTLDFIRFNADGSAIVQGITPIHDANRELPWELPESNDWSTVGGLCVGLAGRIPQAGDRLFTDDALIEILDASLRRVRSVRISQRVPDSSRPGEELPSNSPLRE